MASESEVPGAISGNAASEDQSAKQWTSSTLKNPFVKKMNYGIKDMMIFALMSILVAPFRLISMIILTCIVWFFSLLEVYGSGDKDYDQPISNPSRYALFNRIMCVLGRLMCMTAGFSIEVKGELAPPTVAPVLVGAPHSTIVDGLVLIYLKFPAVVSRIENRNIPLIGKLIDFLRPIFVSRAERSSRTATIDRIKRRVANTQSGHPGYNRQLFLFPEGTCTNGSCLITFKPGAFMPGTPVQPVILKFKNRVDTYSWTFQGQSALSCVWFTLCQPINRVTVEFLPVYTPSEEEKKDCYLFAKNVRAVMAERLGVPTTDHTFEDCRLMMFADSNNYPMSAALVEFDTVRRRLRMSYDDLQSMLARFQKIDRKRRGKISLAELAKHLSLPVIEPVRELFSLYDTDNSGLIDFRDFITGLALISEPCESEHSWKIIFDLFDSDGDGRISEEDLARLLMHNYGMERSEIEHLMALMDTDRDGLVSFTDLMNMVKKRPEYNGLMYVYRKMRRQSVSQKDVADCALEGSDSDDVGSEAHSEESPEICEEEVSPKDILSGSNLKQRSIPSDKEPDRANHTEQPTS